MEQRISTIKKSPVNVLRGQAIENDGSAIVTTAKDCCIVRNDSPAGKEVDINIIGNFAYAKISTDVLKDDYLIPGVGGLFEPSAVSGTVSVAIAIEDKTYAVGDDLVMVKVGSYLIP